MTHLKHTARDATWGLKSGPAVPPLPDHSGLDSWGNLWWLMQTHPSLAAHYTPTQEWLDFAKGITPWPLLSRNLRGWGPGNGFFKFSRVAPVCKVKTILLIIITCFLLSRGPALRHKCSTCLFSKIIFYFSIIGIISMYCRNSRRKV